MNEGHGARVVAPIILHSDETALPNYRKITEHPIYLSIGNLACEDIRYLLEGHCLLAILPNFNVQGHNFLQHLQAFQSCL